MGNQLLCGTGGGRRRRRKNSSDYAGDTDDDGDDDDGGGGDSYAERARIDNEVLAERFRHWMQPSVRRRPDNGRGVTFRLESFDSQVSTESERLDFVARLIDSLPETFLDDHDGDANGRPAAVSSTASMTVSALVSECPASDATTAVHSSTPRQRRRLVTAGGAGRASGRRNASANGAQHVKAKDAAGSSGSSQLTCPAPADTATAES